MAVITPPSPLPLRRVQWRLRRPQQDVTSEWTGRGQTVLLPGASRWLVSGEFPPVLRPELANPWIGFFAELDGMANCFPLRAVEKQQTTLANPTVNGGSQTGSTLNLSGLPTGVGLTVLPKGSRATIPMTDGSVQLVVLTSALVGASGGNGSMTFKAPLRASPANGATVEIKLPYAYVRMTSPEPGWDAETGQVYGFAFEGREWF